MKKSTIKSAQIALQNAIPYYATILGPFLASHPVWMLAFYAATGLYGIYMAYNQEEVNEIIEFIKEHPQEFREEKVKSKEFEKVFLLFFEQYLKQRTEEKKKVLKNILLGYTLTGNKADYELERLNDCLVRVTIPTLKFLVFMKNKIIPVLETEINKELMQDTYQKSDLSVEWWFSDMMIKKSVWEVIDKWLNDNFSPSTDKVKMEYRIKQGEEWAHDSRSRAQNRERNKRNEVNECIFELVTLGILRISIPGAAWGGGGGTDYTITTFGLKFLKQMA